MLLGPLAFELCFLSFIALYLQGSSRRHRERQNLKANEQDRNIETICSAYCFALKRFVARALYACFTAGLRAVFTCRIRSSPPPRALWLWAPRPVDSLNPYYQTDAVGNPCGLSGNATWNQQQRPCVMFARGEFLRSLPSFGAVHARVAGLAPSARRASSRPLSGWPSCRCSSR